MPAKTAKKRRARLKAPESPPVSIPHKVLFDRRISGNELRILCAALALQKLRPDHAYGLTGFSEALGCTVQLIHRALRVLTALGYITCKTSKDHDYRFKVEVDPRIFP